MKTIYKSLMALAAALLLVPAAQAQTRQYKLDATSGFAIDKYVKDKNPNENGEYTLRIETFATGEVTVEKKSIPSDIVLVLDASGSMSSNRIVHPTMKVRQGNTASNSYSNTGAGETTATCIFIRYPDNESGSFYRVQHGHQITGGGDTYNDHWLFFDTPDGTKYLYGTWNAANPDACVHDERPAVGAYPAENSVIFKGPTYRYPQRTEVLKAAVKDFIDLIKENDEKEVQPYLETGKTGNQIAIVSFRGDTSPLDFDLDDIEKALTTDATSKALIDFKPVDTEANITALKSAVNSVPASGNTPTDAGMKLAEVLVHNLEKTMPAYIGTTQQRLKTVVLFTDGAPTVSNNTRLTVELPDGTFIDAPNGQRNNIVNYNAMRIGYDLKHIYHVNIFSVGFGATGGTMTFLERLSSNYPDASMVPNAANTSFTTYTGVTNPLPADEQIYYKDAAVDGMEDVFSAIAESVGGGGSTEYDNTPLLAVDMVSSSFKLPEGVDASRVKVYTAQCLGTTGNKVTDDKGNEHDELAFAKEILVKTRGAVSYWESKPVVDADGNPVLDELGNPTYEWTEVTEDIDENIEPVLDPTTNTVTVGGFDYEALWCGLDPEHDNQITYNPDEYTDTYKPGYRGFKLIFEFPIVVADGALGGPDVATNYSSSGVYQTDDQGNKTGLPIVEYPVPSLPIPVNLWIEKRGLLPGESATFTILKKLVKKENESDPEPEYVKFARVNLIGAPDGSPVVEKLLNLDPRYYYKIWEEGWSWSYTNQAQDLENAPSTETITSNPIVITNTYDDPDVKHAEAAKRNEMGKTD